MKRPGLGTRLIGNAASAFVILLGGGYLLFRWWQGQMPSGWVPVIAVLAMITAANANQQLTEYGHWKRAWDAMGGGASPRPSQKTRKIIVGVLWSAIVLVFSQLDYQRRSNVMVAAGFALASVVLIGAALYRTRQRRPPRPLRHAASVPVAISLPVPRQSPDTRQLYEGLPDYCTTLE